MMMGACQVDKTAQFCFGKAVLFVDDGIPLAKFWHLDCSVLISKSPLALYRQFILLLIGLLHSNLQHHLTVALTSRYIAFRPQLLSCARRGELLDQRLIQPRAHIASPVKPDL
jgi:hypothetical protein